MPAETESVVVVESRSRMVSARFKVMELAAASPTTTAAAATAAEDAAAGGAKQGRPGQPGTAEPQEVLAGYPGRPAHAITLLQHLLDPHGFSFLSPGARGAGVPQHPLYGLQPLYGDWMAPDVPCIPETLQLRSIRSSLTIMQ